MGSYDTRGGTPQHDPMFDRDVPLYEFTRPELEAALRGAWLDGWLCCACRLTGQPNGELSSKQERANYVVAAMSRLTGGK